LLELLDKIGPFDGFLVGEDFFSAKVLEKMSPRAKVISRYGVGLDKIDLEAAERLGIKVLNTPGVNHTTVAEHTFGLLLSALRHIPEHNEIVHKGQWKRLTGIELAGKTLGILGFGRVGKEVAKRAMCFGMKVIIYNSSWSAEHNRYLDRLRAVFSDEVFEEYPPQVSRTQSVEEVLSSSDILSLNMNLTKHNLQFLNSRRLSMCKRGVIIVNVSQGNLIDQYALADAIRSGQVAAFAADVLYPEPVEPTNPLLGLPYVHLTPHIGSRTVDSVIRQGLAAVKNLRSVLEQSQN